MLYAVTLWDALKFEILNVQEEDLAEKSLEGLRSIAQQLSKGTPAQLQAYLQPIAKECNEHLEDAPTKQSQATGRILQSLVSASPQAANFLITAIIPNIFTLYNTADSMAKRRGLFEVLAKIIRSDIAVFGEWRSTKEWREAESVQTSGEPTLATSLPENAFSRFSGQALTIMTNGLSTAPVKEVSFRLTMLDGLLQLAKLRQLLSDDVVASIIRLFYEVLITEESYGKDEIKTAAMNGLVEIAHQKPQLVIDEAFPAFMAKIPDKDEEGLTAYVPVLEAFAKLAMEEKIFQTVVLRLRNKINAAIHQSASSSYLVALLSALFYAFSKGAFPPKTVPVESYYEDVVRPLLLHSADAKTTESNPFTDDSVLDLIGRICNVIIRSLPAADHQTVAMNIYSIYRNQAANTLPPFVEGTAQQQRLMILNAHLLASFRRDAPLPYDAAKLLQSLVTFTQHDSLSSQVRAATLKQISLVVNKFISTAELNAALEPILSAPMDLLSAANLSDTNIRIVFAILKALVLRNSHMLSTLFPSLLEALSDGQHGTTAARGFSTLLQPDDLLIRENFCVVSGLHKQKSFALLVPAIAASFKAGTPETKTNCLIALSGLLRWLPYEILAPEIQSLAPLLLQSLDLRGEEEVKASTIGVLNLILTHSAKAVEEHANSLITRLLNATNSQTNPPAVRADALKCIAIVPGVLRTEIILPLRRQVVKRLTAALDDSKRAVRAEAVRCRTKWLDIDEVGEDD
jgi:DNA repair/transcription protein MET18/MMS19